MNIRKTLSIVLFILLSATFSHAEPRKQAISMTFPAAVVQDILTKSLPLNMEIDSGTLLGAVSIDAVEDLRILQDTLSSKITLSGHKLNLITTIAGQKLRMKIGTLTMSFHCDATIRFNPADQTLYIRPVITDLESSGNRNGDIASAIVLLFNNREFPVALGKLKPISRETDRKTITIAMRVNDVSLQPDTLLLTIIPAVSVSSKTK